MEVRSSAVSLANAINASAPIRLLVSTPGTGRERARTLGHAGYSYGFVFDAFAPILDRLGPWTHVDHPESRLIPLAQQAMAQGERPIHLAIAPLQDIYLTPALPTIAFPFWEFPDLPYRNFGTDTRQNWKRIARYTSAIATACAMTKGSFQGLGLDTQITTIPVPLDDAWFTLAPWTPNQTHRLDCKHIVLTGDSIEEPRQAVATTAQRPTSIARQLKSGYARHIWPHLSTGQRAAIQRLARSIRERRGVTHRPLEPARLSLDGLVFTSVFNMLDERKNPRDLLSAFLLAFADRADATLLLKLTSCPRTEPDILARLHRLHKSLPIPHRCRIVAILDYLTPSQMHTLFEATTAYVNTSHAEGACLPLQQAMAAGRPVVAPRHTAMADYIDSAIGAVVGSTPEPIHWPHDPQKRIETNWHRLDWSSLHRGMLNVAHAAKVDRARYDSWASTARARMLSFAGAGPVEVRLRSLIEEVARQGTWNRLDWNSNDPAVLMNNQAVFDAA